VNKRASLSIGETLRTLREERALTQEQLAQRVGVQQAMIGHWENDRRQPTLYMAARLAEALDVTIDFLASDESPTPA
jgi:transcriptional regulator with XRE-family HTH domain